MMVGLLEGEEEPREAVVLVETERPVDVELDVPTVAVFRAQLQVTVNAVSFGGVHEEIEALEVVLLPFSGVDFGDAVFLVHVTIALNCAASLRTSRLTYLMDL